LEDGVTFGRIWIHTKATRSKDRLIRYCKSKWVWHRASSWTTPEKTIYSTPESSTETGFGGASATTRRGGRSWCVSECLECSDCKRSFVFNFCKTKHHLWERIL
jgi:hypothetical protein